MAATAATNFAGQKFQRLEMSDSFRVGEKAPCTGLYKAIHAGHAGPHEVTILFDEVFPACLACGNSVQFALLVRSVHIDAHPMFARDP